jgi:two-component system chemotaxis response regulator CheY
MIYIYGTRRASMKVMKTINEENALNLPEESEEHGILIVDDSKFSRNILKDILKNEGFQVIAEAKNGLEAIEMTKLKKPQYIFLDVEMPMLDGLGALPRLLEVDPHVNIIMCTAMGQKNIIVEAARSGAKDYVLKPYKKENIIRVLSLYIEEQKKEAQIIPFKSSKKLKDEAAKDISDNYKSTDEIKVQEGAKEVTSDNRKSDDDFKVNEEVVKDTPDNLKSDDDLKVNEEAVKDTPDNQKSEDDFKVNEEAVKDTLDNLISDDDFKVNDEAVKDTPDNLISDDFKVNEDAVKDTLDNLKSDDDLKVNEEAIKAIIDNEKSTDEFKEQEDAQVVMYEEAQAGKYTEDGYMDSIALAKRLKAEVEEALSEPDNTKYNRIGFYLKELNEKKTDNRESALDNSEPLALEWNLSNTDGLKFLEPLDYHENGEADSISNDRLTEWDEEQKVLGEEDGKELFGEDNLYETSLLDRIQEDSFDSQNEDDEEIEYQKAIAEDKKLERDLLEEYLNSRISLHKQSENENTENCNRDEENNNDHDFQALQHSEEIEIINTVTEGLDSEPLITASFNQNPFEYLWESRFKIRQEAVLTWWPDSQRVSFFSGEKLSEDENESKVRKTSEQEILYGMISAYLCLGNRLVQEEMNSKIHLGTCPTGIRILAGRILGDEKKDQSEDTMADILKKNADNDWQISKAYIQKTSLANAMEQLVHSKVSRALVKV